jgi:aryl-alcohol dehydrogenase-like predicted oxidoreductase
MIYRILGKTDLEVSVIGMGCSGIGRSLHNNNTGESLRTLTRAFECGINFFDTAPNYSNGESEILIGKALKGRRDNIIISSKVGVDSTAAGLLAKKIKPYLNPVRNILNPLKYSLPRIYKTQRRLNFSPDFIFKTVEGSLKRLQTSYLDLLLLHHPTNKILETGEFLPAFELLKSRDKVKFFGVSCDSLEQAFLSLNLPEVSVLQIELSMIDPEPIAELLPLAVKKNVGIIARLPFAKGLLTDKISGTKAERWAYDKNRLLERIKLAEELSFLKIKNRTLAQSALQFVINQTGVSAALPGISSRIHLEENISSLSAPQFTNEEIQKIFSINYKKKTEKFFS